mmetsp:Transcript_19196/g.29098  ORF Transcript_19196/g.29098 Transcript_19196/m.29098 type:complete len:273 (+) Transcript_19196:83-901(+)|eukprot:CAMPEP_0197311148 /NCGR_PEP_ID=MMETSP0891-20130614/9664_1 /TAXON_ID=44058 ORGANISM="Aureoumbra lagunensis, Strain CCMP1510" /NCGR_SAMPLE_ID=MMETSP0891 /ASSEMBLY_ACC=CAM_ASM_000534 /LENGTH=272 /DNA_ID=CAMNT_0042797123 /DNA_START=12 /DNA_END=830 /DNA_ORIENTATION=+
MTTVEEITKLVSKQNEEYQLLTERLRLRWGDGTEDLPPSEVLAHELSSTIDELNDERDRRADAEAYARNWASKLEDQTNALVRENTQLKDQLSSAQRFLNDKNLALKELEEKCNILESNLHLSDRLGTEKNREIEELRTRLRDSVYIGDLSLAERYNVRQIFEKRLNEEEKSATTTELNLLRQCCHKKKKKRGRVPVGDDKKTKSSLQHPTIVHNTKSRTYSQPFAIPPSGGTDLTESAGGRAGGDGLYLLNGYASTNRRQCALPTFVPDSF